MGNSCKKFALLTRLLPRNSAAREHPELLKNDYSASQYNSDQDKKKGPSMALKYWGDKILYLDFRLPAAGSAALSHAKRLPDDRFQPWINPFSPVEK